MIKNYFFDFDKTLADTGELSVIATQDAFKATGLTAPDRNLILDMMGIPAEVSVPKMAKEELTPSQVKGVCDQFRMIYRLKELENTNLYPQIIELLKTLYENHKNLFVVSSKATEPLRRNLESLNILNLFTETIGCDLVEHYKPAPDGLNILIDKYSLSRPESMMIGDARYDVQMGQNAGIKTCGAKWGAFDISSLEAAKPTYLADSPLDILQIR